MRCPICKKTVDPVTAERWLPFCSDRCKLVDLGRWLSGKYSIPAEPDDDSADEARPEPTKKRDSSTDAD